MIVRLLIALFTAFSVSISLTAQDFNPLKPYEGPTKKGVSTEGLAGKVMTGYQGWFNCPGDGASLGWTHWAKNKTRLLGPGNVTVDLWPDLSEYGPGERFGTGFQMRDGSQAQVFSSHNRETVLRHFRWMREYGIDGAFVQRFANGVKKKSLRYHKDVVLSHCREGANREGRAYAVMYDLSGLQEGSVQRIEDDWDRLRSKMRIADDSAYLKHKGKPLVAIWGVGFNDGRRYTLTECQQLIQFFKERQCSVMLGVPTGWRNLERDAIRDSKLHLVLKSADIISPWTPGRYRTPNQVQRHAERFWGPDLQWCEENALEYLPVVFPGFSWHNLKPDSPLDLIPRLEGRFLWSQFVEAKRSGAQMIYVAMFDEVDEATAIFKCTNQPPIGSNVEFLTYQGLPSDHYLWLTGEGGRLLRNQTPLSNTIPIRNPKTPISPEPR